MEGVSNKRVSVLTKLEEYRRPRSSGKQLPLQIDNSLAARNADPLSPNEHALPTLALPTLNLQCLHLHANCHWRKFMNWTLHFNHALLALGGAYCSPLTLNFQTKIPLNLTFHKAAIPAASQKHSLPSFQAKTKVVNQKSIVFYKMQMNPHLQHDAPTARPNIL